MIVSVTYINSVFHPIFQFKVFIFLFYHIFQTSKQKPVFS